MNKSSQIDSITEQSIIIDSGVVIDSNMDNNTQSSDKKDSDYEIDNYHGENTSIDRDSLASYIRKVRSIPLLSEESELMHAKKWAEEGNRESAHILVQSHLRLVVKIASGYRGYGLPFSDLISEGSVGLMHAVKGFDYTKGFRLSTYASYWIKAKIQEYVLRSWSLVKIGTTVTQKKLFFNLRKIKSKIGAIDKNNLTSEQLELISKELNVPQEEIVEVNNRMLVTGDASLNSPVGNDGAVWEDWIEDKNKGIEESYIDNDEMKYRKELLGVAMSKLNEREKDIFMRRRLNDDIDTLDVLSKQYNISKERVRQIENNSYEKLKNNISLLIKESENIKGN